MKSIKEQLDGMVKRSITLHGYTLAKDETGNLVEVDADKANKEFLRMLAGIEPDPKKQSEMIIEAWNDKTGDKQRALNAVRVETVGNFIASDSTFGAAYFEQVTLKDDEEPKILNDSKQEVRVGNVSPDGTPDRVRVVKPNSKQDIGLAIITSDIVRYVTLDIIAGRVDGVAKATFDIGRDLQIQYDKVHFNLLSAALASGGAFGAFSYEQARTKVEQRIFVAHSAIKTIHLPSTNIILNSTGTPASATSTVRAAMKLTDYETTASTGLRPAVLDAIVDYQDSWGNYLPGGRGRLMATGDIICPPSDIINIAKTLLLENNTNSTSLQQQVQENGYTSLRRLGKDWRFIGDATLVKGTCYPVFNLKPGRSYNKPIWSKEIVERNERENWEERSQQRMCAPYIVSQFRPSALKITYV
jgi:hypothetical protein